MNQDPLKSTALSTYQYAPTNVAFMHTSGAQFTHFSESKSGTRTTFGLSCVELLALAKPAIEQFIQQNRNLKEKVITDLLAELSGLSKSLNQMVEDLKRGSSVSEIVGGWLGKEQVPPSYSTDSAVAVAVVESGHIPIMLSAILPAIQYSRAARSVGASDVAYYFGKMVGARDQAREYCVKQDMMKAIANFRAKINFQRCSLPQGEALSFCNTLVTMLDEKIINPNRKSLPTDCETFDLFETFVSKVYDLWCQIPVRADRPKFVELIIALQHALCRIPHDGHTTYHYQKAVSDAVYEVLIDFMKKAVGLTKDSEGIQLTKEQDDYLQGILPMIEYLNSSLNPFARDGLFGEMVTNDFHTIALKAYAEHESRERPEQDKMPRRPYTHTPKASTHAKFSMEQKIKLVFGSEEEAEEDEVATKSTTSGLLQRMGGLMLEGSTSAQGASRSDSDRRSELLALPMPERYTNLLTYVAPSAVVQPPAPTTTAKGPSVAASKAPSSTPAAAVSSSPSPAAAKGSSSSTTSTTYSFTSYRP